MPVRSIKLPKATPLRERFGAPQFPAWTPDLDVIAKVWGVPPRRWLEGDTSLRGRIVDAMILA